MKTGLTASRPQIFASKRAVQRVWRVGWYLYPPGFGAESRNSHVTEKKAIDARIVCSNHFYVTDSTSEME